jgi:hypothetical protein
LANKTREKKGQPIGETAVDGKYKNRSMGHLCRQRSTVSYLKRAQSQQLPETKVNMRSPQFLPIRQRQHGSNSVDGKSVVSAIRKMATNSLNKLGLHDIFFFLAGILTRAKRSEVTFYRQCAGWLQLVQRG